MSVSEHKSSSAANNFISLSYGGERPQTMTRQRHEPQTVQRRKGRENMKSEELWHGNVSSEDISS